MLGCVLKIIIRKYLPLPWKWNDNLLLYFYLSFCYMVCDGGNGMIKHVFGSTLFIGHVPTYNLYVPQSTHVYYHGHLLLLFYIICKYLLHVFSNKPATFLFYFIYCAQIFQDCYTNLSRYWKNDSYFLVQCDSMAFFYSWKINSIHWHLEMLICILLSNT